MKLFNYFLIFAMATTSSNTMLEAMNKRKRNNNKDKDSKKLKKQTKISSSSAENQDNLDSDFEAKFQALNVIKDKSIDDISKLLQAFSLTQEPSLLKRILAKIPTDKQKHFLPFDEQLLQWALNNGYSLIIEELVNSTEEKALYTIVGKTLHKAATSNHLKILNTLVTNKGTNCYISDKQWERLSTYQGFLTNKAQKIIRQKTAKQSS